MDEWKSKASRVAVQCGVYMFVCYSYYLFSHLSVCFVSFVVSEGGGGELWSFLAFSQLCARGRVRV